MSDNIVIAVDGSVESMLSTIDDPQSILMRRACWWILNQVQNDGSGEATPYPLTLPNRV